MLFRSTLEQVTGALTQVAHNVGAAFPSLIPYTTSGAAALQGINQIVATILEARFQPQVKTATFALYPLELNEPFRIGKAPLQTGAYAFFFEKVELGKLRMGDDGIITSIDNQTVSPYIVVNIEKGITLAQGQIAKNLATEVLETYNRMSSYPLSPTNTTVNYFEALEELGKTIRLATSTQRYFELKGKGDNLSEAEAKRLEILFAYLKENLHDFEKMLR